MLHLHFHLHVGLIFRRGTVPTYERMELSPRGEKVVDIKLWRNTYS